MQTSTLDAGRPNHRHRRVERPDPAWIVDWLDEHQRTILRITPQKVLLHE
jgi:hypothetical protein